MINVIITAITKRNGKINCTIVASENSMNAAYKTASYLGDRAIK